MSGIVPEFEAGKPISAAALERVRMNAERVGGFQPGAPGAAMLVGVDASITRFPVFVVERSVSAPARLSAHSYTVTDGDAQWPVDHTRLVVGVEPELIDGSPPMGFVPAEVSGQGLAVDQPWRSWGVLIRGPGGTPNTSDYAVLLYGLVPWRNC